MKAVTLAVVIGVSSALAHAGEMKGMDMKDMSPSGMAKDAKNARHTAQPGCKRGASPSATGTI